MKKRKVQTVIFHRTTDNRKHFLLLKMRKDRGGFWQNVTGGVDPNENFDEAALREAIEETAIKKMNILNFESLNYRFEFHDRWDNDVIEEVYSLEAKERWDVIIDPLEHTEFKWVSEEILDKTSVHFETNFKALNKIIGKKNV